MENSISPNYHNLRHQGLGPTNPMVLVKTANGFDRQAGISSIINKLGLSTTEIPVELHIPSYKFTVPGTNLFYESEERPGRLNDDSSPKEWSKLINGIDQAAYYHDCDYYRAENSGLSSDEILKLKNIADIRMIARLENYTRNGFMERFIKFALIKLLHAKVKFNMLINLDLFLIDSFSDDANQIVAQLHKPIRHKFSRRKVIVYKLDEI